MTYFVNNEHQENFNQFISEANVSEKEYTAKSVLYLLSSLPKVALNIDEFYVLAGKYVNFNGLETMHFSSGEQTIVALAYNLYNGYKVEGVDLTPGELLCSLDKELRQAVVQAMNFKMGLN